MFVRSAKIEKKPQWFLLYRPAVVAYEPIGGRTDFGK
jgi:hypothetical protein